jgi:hypothetical protein
MNNELQQFVREALARGLSRDEIRSTLATARWRAEEIDAELERWGDGPAGLPVPRRRLSLSAREAFMHLVLFATLYTFAYSVGVILFSLISLHVPDPAVRGYSSELGAMRAALAALLTAFPIYLWMSRLLGVSLVREPEKRASGIRRWLTYLTLFIAVLTLIGTFVGVLTSMLSGEMTLRIVLQSLVVFSIAGLIFGHYLMGLRRDESEGAAAPAKPGLLGRIAVVGTVVVLIAGFANVGTPGNIRARVLDSKRLEGLKQLSSLIEQRVQNKHALPRSLDAVFDENTGYDRSYYTDPLTHQAYEYEVTDSVTFVLGATFATGDSLDADGNPIDHEWRHAAGPVRFTRTAGPHNSH